MILTYNGEAAEAEEAVISSTHTKSLLIPNVLLSKILHSHLSNHTSSEHLQLTSFLLFYIMFALYFSATLLLE